METVSPIIRLKDQRNYLQWSEATQRRAAREGFLSLIRDCRYTDVIPPEAADYLVYVPVEVQNQSDPGQPGSSLIDDPSNNQSFVIDEVESRLLLEQKWHEYVLIKERLLSASRFLVASLTNVVAVHLLRSGITYYNPHEMWMLLKKRYGEPAKEAVAHIMQAANNLRLADCSSMLEYLDRQSSFTAQQMDIMASGIPSSEIAGWILRGLTSEYKDVSREWRPRIEGQNYDNINNPISRLYDDLLKKEKELSLRSWKGNSKRRLRSLLCQRPRQARHT